MTEPPDNDRANRGPNRAPNHGIAMWGAPGSGKTTFLAALDSALTRVDGDWKVIGTNPASAQVLSNLATGLAGRGAFPRATEGIEHYDWSLVGSRTRTTGRWPRRHEETVEHRVGLDVLDASGETYDSGVDAGRIDPRLLDGLERSRAIVYLFDPIREYELGDAYEHLTGVLAQLAQRMLDHPDFVKGRLPHHLAVCVTKFDERRVLKTADAMEILEFGEEPPACPRVDDEDAADLFRELCGVSASGNAGLVLNKLMKYFRPDRIKFFVSSAIGFYVDPRTGRFDPRDFQNLVPAPDSPHGYRIRGELHPINVMEPMLWLAEQLSTGSPGR